MFRTDDKSPTDDKSLTDDYFYLPQIPQISTDLSSGSLDIIGLSRGEQTGPPRFRGS